VKGALKRKKRSINCGEARYGAAPAEKAIGQEVQNTRLCPGGIEKREQGLKGEEGGKQKRRRRINQHVTIIKKTGSGFGKNKKAKPSEGG